MELDSELTPFPNSVKFYWDFFAEKMGVSQLEAGMKLSQLYFENDCLVLE